MEDTTVLKITNLCKNFGDVKVLKGVDFTLKKSRVLGLVGENGAGKSTLLNVIGGVHPITSGSIELFGQDYCPRAPKDAIKSGIAFIHQELNLFTNLTVAENLFIDEGLEGKSLINPSTINQRARDVLEKLSCDLNPSTKVEDLAMGMRQMVEIAKAVSKKARVIFFDEPTTSLSTAEKETLFKLVREFSAQGISMIYISHALDDVFMLCDEILVIRDGETVGEQVSVKSITKDQVINRMVGREIGQIYPYVAKTAGEALLEIDHIVRQGVLNDISLTVKSGEIVGLFGLMGAGRTELARAVYGLDEFDSGTIKYKGKSVSNPNPRLWVREKVAFITENRRDEGLLLPKNVSDNIALASLKRIMKKLGILDRKQQSANSTTTIKQLKIKTSDENRQIARNLSGGNQQKVVIGKWMLIDPDFFILDEPTRGVDVGAKFEIYTHINQQAANGAGVLFISSEMEELIGICDRIVVMNRGRIAGELERRSFSSDSLLKLALGDFDNECN